MAKVLIISSPGGHWIQAQRLIPAFENSNEVCISSTYRQVEDSLSNFQYYSITDFNRKKFSGILETLRSLKNIENNFKPDVIITTGAAPGLLAGLYWFLRGRKTIWIDSIANSERISLSGKLASYFFTITLTQWSDLQSKNIKYKGRVI